MGSIQAEMLVRCIRPVARLEEQEGVLAVGDPVSSETHAHPPTQRLNVQEPLG